MSEAIFPERISTVPKVNLLPAQIEDERKFKRLQSILALCVVASLGVSVAGWQLANVSVSHAQNELDAATAVTNGLRGQVAQYARVPETETKLAAARLTLTTALGGEVLWSRRLNELGLTIPPKVWLTGVTVAPAQAVPANAAATTAAAATSSVATMTFTGMAYSHDDVAAWLDSLAQITDSRTGKPIYTDVFMSSSRQTKIGTETAVQFSTSANVSTNALSLRYLNSGTTLGNG